MLDSNVVLKRKVLAYASVKKHLKKLKKMQGQRTPQFFEQAAVVLDTYIADKFNLYFDKIRKLCRTCFNVQNCRRCIFYLNIEDEHVMCSNFMNYKKFSDYFAKRFDYLERKPEIYNDLMQETVIE
jgi:hypothetical protein